MTERSRAFRAAIADFIQARRETKLKGQEDDAGAASKYEYTTWLTDAASRAHNLQVVTHPIKFTHSSIKGASSIYFGQPCSSNRPEIGTHSLTEAPNEDFAISDAKHLDVYSLLMNVNVEEKRLLDWVRLADPDLVIAFHDDPNVAATILTGLQRVTHNEGIKRTSTLAKQVYWLQGDDPTDNAQFHLLQPMFSSSLEHAVHTQIRESRNAAFEARGTKKQKPTYADHCTFPDLVGRTLGGANAQNVSPMNKVRGGVNYLLPSLPPPAWNARGMQLLRKKSIFDELLRFGDMRELVRALADFLKSNPDPTAATRMRRESIEQALIEEFTLFGATTRGSLEAGWTRNVLCYLPCSEQLWLDPERTLLPLREAPEQQADDMAFNLAYDAGEWADEVASGFGDWLNARLHKAGLISVSETERKHWARLAIIDVQWPMPKQGQTSKETQ